MSKARGESGHLPQALPALKPTLPSGRRGFDAVPLPTDRSTSFNGCSESPPGIRTIRSLEDCNQEESEVSVGLASFLRKDLRSVASLGNQTVELPAQM